MHKVDFCCCGCSLRDGTLILLWVDVILYSICLVLSISGLTSFLVFAAMLAIEVAALYGVFNEKPGFLVAHMVWQLIWVSVIVIIMVLLIIGPAIMLQVLQSINVHGSPTTRTQKFDLSAGILEFTLLLELIFGSLAGLQYYFFVVVLSLYRKINEDGPRDLRGNF